MDELKLPKAMICWCCPEKNILETLLFSYSFLLRRVRSLLIFGISC